LSIAPTNEKSQQKKEILSISFIRWSRLKQSQGKGYSFECEEHHRGGVTFRAAKFPKIEKTRTINTD
jgi:hypothetical protein